MKKQIDAASKHVRALRFSDYAHWVLEQGLAVQQIPAPTFDEQLRAAYVESQFHALGLTDISTDDLYNVYGRLPGKHSTAPGVMVLAHTDTVFSAETDLTIRRENGMIYGPGLGDNSVGVSGMLGLAYLLHKEGITPACDLYFVATSREEGLGDLGGMKAAFERLKSRLGAVINIEGLAFGHIYHAGIAVKRLHITAKTEGGHSWLHFGRASAIHGMIQLGARITDISVPASPRTTYNIGLVEGGQSINSIAADASLWLDMRSEDRAALENLESQVRRLVDSLTTNALTFTIQVVGDRPAGFLSPEHPLVKGAVAALAEVGVQAALETGSTDGNIPLAAGMPTVTVGITRGGNAHRLDEYMETDAIASGLKQLTILVLAASQAQTE